MPVTVNTKSGSTYTFVRGDNFILDADLPGVHVTEGGEVFAVVRDVEMALIEDEPDAPNVTVNLDGRELVGLLKAQR